MRYNTSIHTATGLPFDPFDDRPDSIRIKDIAMALSRTCRWRGQFKKGVKMLSVAEHSWRVSMILPKEAQLLGLLHDAAEWVFGDVPSPVKRVMPEFCALEERLLQRILLRFSVPQSPELWDLVHNADAVMATDEAKTFLVDAVDGWWKKDTVVPDPRLDLTWARRSGHWTLSPREAERFFLKRFRELTDSCRKK